MPQIGRNRSCLNSRKPISTAPLISIKSQMNPTSVPDPLPLKKTGWLCLVLGNLVVLSVFGVAAWLKPNPNGFGTHQQLGLPPCTIRMIFQVPCPSCGMTTSFANFVRGRWISAIQANAAGFLLAVISLLFLPWSWISLSRRNYWKLSNPHITFIWILISLCLSAILNWLAMIYWN